MIKFLLVFFVLVVVAFIFVLIWSNTECKKIVTTKYTIKSKLVSEDFNNYKILFLVDMHNYFYNSEKIIQVCKEEKPEIIILGGDMVVYNPDKYYDILSMADYISELSKIAPVYYAPGNHEMGWDQKGNKDIWSQYMYKINESVNLKYLSNDHIDITKNASKIRIYGLDLRYGYYKRITKKKLTTEALNDLLGKVEEDVLSILIAHNPDYFKEYSRWGADLVFSGHNHGGLVRIPFIGGVMSPRLRLFPKYDRGRFRYMDSEMILSGGLGAHSVKIRVNNIPELVIVNLQKE